MKNRELIKELLNYNLDAEVTIEVTRPNDDYNYIYSDVNSVFFSNDEIVISEEIGG